MEILAELFALLGRQRGTLVNFNRALEDTVTRCRPRVGPGAAGGGEGAEGGAGDGDLAQGGAAGDVDRLQGRRGGQVQVGHAGAAVQVQLPQLGKRRQLLIQVCGFDIST